MKRSVLLKKINRRKKLLNYLLGYLNPTNTLMVILSQNLDKYIAIYQKHEARRNKHKAKTNILKRSAA